MTSLNDLRLTFLYLKKYKKLTGFTLLILLLASVLEGIGIGIIIPMLQTMTGAGENDKFFGFAKSIYSFLNINYTLITLSITFAFIMVIKFAMVAMQMYYTRIISASVTLDIRKNAFKNLMELPLGYHYNKKVGNTISTIYTSAENAGSVIELLLEILVAVFFLCVYVSVGLLISVKLTLIAVILASLSYLLILPKFRLGFSHGKEEKSLVDKISSFLQDKMSGIKTIKTFNNERYHTGEFNKLASAYKELSVKIQYNRIAANMCLEPFATLLIISLMIVSIVVLKIPVIHVLTFFYIFTRILPKAQQINNHYLNIVNFLPHFSKAHELIDRDDKIYINDGAKEIIAFNDKVEFRNVSFKHKGANKQALRNINLNIEKNKTTAILGGSGGGKTTIVDLLLRMHDPSEGEVFIDGLNLNTVKRGGLHRIISMVEQDAYLFNDTIYRNIVYGEFNANMDDVVNAAKLANAHEFINRLSDGYNTMVGGRGMTLSGGERQRIALARAIIRNPGILILDEATSALDSESEAVILQSIEKLKTMTTIVMIAHRLSTVANADMIYVIGDGSMIESGAPKELAAREGAYWKLLKKQGLSLLEKS